VPISLKNNNIWMISGLEPHRSGEIVIKGKIFNKIASSNIISGEITYRAVNFSSEFKKTAMFETTINNIRANIDVESFNNILIDQEQDLKIKYAVLDNSYISNLRLSFVSPESVSITPPKKLPENVELLEDNSWKIKDLTKEEKEIVFKCKVSDSASEKENLILKFEYQDENGNYYLVAEKELTLEVIKNNLNMILSVNGSDQDQNFNLGDTLNYSLSYSNKGDSVMKDVVFMVVFDESLLDWSSFSDKNGGVVENNTIAWTKNQLPELSLIDKGSDGKINFSVKLKEVADEKGTSEMKSYAKFSFSDRETFSNTSSTLAMIDDLLEDDTSVNKSNVINIKIKSNLELNEQIKYFNDDNIAVGTGPVPLKVGEATSLKVYWTINNTLHDLSNIEVSASLPEYVSWNGKEQASTGLIDYDEENNRVYWQINKSSANSVNPRAEFSISIIPRLEDVNTILVLLPGTKIKAIDNKINTEIIKENKVKTSKLEDDEVFSSYEAIVEEGQ
jgi:hypothetical protein